MNIKEAKHIHFTGIKGTGLVSLVCCALDLGIKVTGSDVEEEFVTDETLKKRGVSWNIGFKKEHLEPKPDVLVYTGAHGGLQNPEVIAAQELGIPVLSHFEALAQFAEGKKLIAVCGVGGKTTTSAMIATILEHSGVNPSWAIGVADVPSLGAPGHYDEKGEYFVTEADEYVVSPGVNNTPKFLMLNPHIIVVTNIEHDHPDVYPTFEDTKKAYKEFFKKLPEDGFLIINGDNKNSMDLLQDEQNNFNFQFGTYGQNNALWKFTNIHFSEGLTEFELKTDPELDDEMASVRIKVPGIFNVYNAVAAYSASQAALVNSIDALNGLSKFVGSKRRFEKVAEVNEILLYDDYAHHPSEIEATLKATRDWFPNSRIWVYFQPHTYTRTKALLNEFAKAFNAADFVGIDEIFASAREQKDETISSQLLVDEIKKHHPNPENVNYVTQEDAVDTLAKNLKPGDVFLTLGAGDVYKVHSTLIQKLKGKNQN